jgi:hypothetical protein
VADYEELQNEVKHTVVLYNSPEGVLESCDYAPLHRKRMLVDAGDEDRLWRPHVLIYNGNTSS